jgi:hypothetical protein
LEETAMKKHVILASAASFGLALSAAPNESTACGEGQFNMGQGLKYQSYLAPRPAAVLVYDAGASETSPQRRAALINGLRASGHKVTEVGDDAALAQALQAGHFDVVIASYERMDQVSTSSARSGADAPKLLPVVARKLRNAPEVRSRYSSFVLDGASLGQYLKAINTVLPASAP